MPKPEYSTEEVITLLSHLLNDRKIQQSEELTKACNEYPDLIGVVDTIIELRAVTASLSKGSLGEDILSRGYIMSSIKALQANLHHLVWQLAQVSKGDFSQRIDFLGEFSESFNAMCEKLEGQTLFLTELAMHDSLTKLANRQYFDEYIEDLFEGVRRGDMDFSFMMIDIDYFKKVNDDYGHGVGDIVLENIARYLLHVFRTSDFVARYGGEEFVVVLPHVSLDQAVIIAERTREYFENNPIIVDEDVSITVTASIGITEVRATDTSPEQVIKRSDEALYRAKSKGRNRIECV